MSLSEPQTTRFARLSLRFACLLIIALFIKLTPKKFATSLLATCRIRLTKFVCDDEEKPTEAELPLGGPGAGDDDPCIFIKFNFTNVEDYPEGSTVSGSMVSEQNLEVENRKVRTREDVTGGFGLCSSTQCPRKTSYLTHPSPLSPPLPPLAPPLPPQNPKSLPSSPFQSPNTSQSYPLPLALLPFPLLLVPRARFSP